VELTVTGLDMPCPACGMRFHPDALAPHVNTCPRFTCVACGVKFGILPEPLRKRFGLAPLCAACNARPR